MNTKKALFAVCCGAACLPLHAEIVVRPAQQADLPGVLDLDRRVTFEYFKPLFAGSYAYLIGDNNIDDVLNLDLVHDAEKYEHAVATQGNDRLHVACDTKNDRIVGFLSFHTIDTVLELDLLVVDQDYRKQGIGRALIQSTENAFPDATTITLYVLQKGNDATLQFYEKLGFVNKGPASAEILNEYGIPRSEMYFVYERALQPQMTESADAQRLYIMFPPQAYYKLVRESDFDATRKGDCVRLSPLDVQSGFIHVSFGKQVMSTVRKFFARAGTVLALEIDMHEFQLYGAQVRVESNKPGGERYPHIYGTNKIPLMAVKKVVRCQENADGSWSVE